MEERKLENEDEAKRYYLRLRKLRRILTAGILSVLALFVIALAQEYSGIIVINDWLSRIAVLLAMLVFIVIIIAGLAPWYYYYKCVSYLRIDLPRMKSIYAVYDEMDEIAKTKNWF